MKKILLIVLVLIVGCAEKPINIEALNERDDVFYTKDTNELYTGAVFGLYESGEKRGEAYLKDGKFDGKLTEYYENGQISGGGNIKDGEKVGKWTDYYENGQIEEEGNYKGNWIKDCKWTYYNEDGSIDKVEEYKDGKLAE